MLTGYDNQAAGVSLEKVNRFPSVGAVVAHRLGATASAGLPNFVALPNDRQLRNRFRYTLPLQLGAACGVFDSGAIPETTVGRYRLPTGLTLPVDISPRRLRQRRQILASLGHRNTSTAGPSTGQKWNAFRQTSYKLLAGQQGQQAFNFNREPRRLREMDDPNAVGQGTFLARRLVEAGVSCVLANSSINNSWDAHSDNFNTLKDTLLPPMDQPASALLTDLQQRGMLDEVLVLMLGEKGTTPRVNKEFGRDHWPDVYSLMIAGGGLDRGQVLGSSTRHSETPRDRPVHYDEILATLYHQLGIAPDHVVADGLGRPFRIMPEAEPFHELLAQPLQRYQWPR